MSSIYRECGQLLYFCYVYDIILYDAVILGIFLHWMLLLLSKPSLPHTRPATVSIAPHNVPTTHTEHPKPPRQGGRALETSFPRSTRHIDRWGRLRSEMIVVVREVDTRSGTVILVLPSDGSTNVDQINVIINETCFYTQIYIVPSREIRLTNV